MESPWATQDLVEAVKSRIKPLPGRVVVLVNLDKQTDTWNDGVLVPDRIFALQDRAGHGMPRCGTIAASADKDVESGERWMVDSNEGQWWMSTEADSKLGISLPNNWQIRLYMNSEPLLVRRNDN